MEHQPITRIPPIKENINIHTPNGIITANALQLQLYYVNLIPSPHFSQILIHNFR
jgi:hypothetical protein